MKYYGLDWAAMAFSLVALYLIGNKNRYGFVSFMAANMSWIAVGSILSNQAIIVGNVVFFVSNLRGYLNWSATRVKS
jgi:TctA family transporter